MSGGAGTTGSYQWNRAEASNLCQLRSVIAISNSVPVHAVQYDFPCAEILDALNPVQGPPPGFPGFLQVASELADVVDTILLETVDSNHNTLCTEALCQFGDQCRGLKCRRVDRYLVSATIQHGLGIRYASNSTCDAERNIENGSNIGNPAPVDDATVRACRYVVKDQFISAIANVTLRQLENFTGETVIAKLDALDDFAVEYIEARNYATCRNGSISCLPMRPSRSARPVIAACTPVSRSARRSAACRTPPDA